MDRGVYCGYVKFRGEEHEKTLLAANNYAWGLLKLRRFEEVKTLMRKTMPVARRALGANNKLTLTMRWAYARALYMDPAATLRDLRKAVTTLEDARRTGRRVLGGPHPLTKGMESELRNARAALDARETQSPRSN